MNIHVHTHTYMYVHAHTHIYMYRYIYSRIHTHLYMYTTIHTIYCISLQQTAQMHQIHIHRSVEVEELKTKGKNPQKVSTTTFTI